MVRGGKGEGGQPNFNDKKTCYPSVKASQRGVRGEKQTKIVPGLLAREEDSRNKGDSSFLVTRIRPPEKDQL